MRPEGDQRDDVLDAAGKVLRTDDPEAKIRELLDKAFKESDNPDTSYEKDIEPWLGEKAGVWVTGVDRDEPGYVALVATKDTEKAQEAIDEGIKDEGGAVKERSYEGVDYQVDEDGVAAGIVGDFFTVGTEPEFKRTVKANDGDSLADDKKYKDTVDEHRRGPPRALLHRPQAVLRAGDQGRPQRGAADPAAALGVPDRQARADGRRAAGRRRPDRVRHADERPGRRRAARVRPVPRHRRDAAGQGAAR